MPNKTVYIRKENELSWDSLENKSDWVNDKLSNTAIRITEGKPVITPRNQDMKFCSHGAVKGFCKKGCK